MMTTNHFPRRAVTAAFIFGLAAISFAQQPLNTNLMVNGDFESGTTAGWTPVVGAFATRSYGTLGTPSPAVAAAAGGGTFLATATLFFDSTLRQTFDVSGNAADIDADNLDARVRALLGGVASIPDTARINVRFLDTGGTIISTSTISPITSTVRNFMTVVLQRDETFRIPVLTRTIHVEILFDNLNGAANEGVADEVEFELLHPTAPVALPLGAELLVNGGFENGDVLTPGNANGWRITSGPLRIPQYGQADVPATTVATAINGGTFLAGADGSALGRLEQSIDVFGNETAIDAGTLALFVSGHFGGVDADSDDARINVSFLDDTGGALLADTIGPVTNLNRNRQTTLMRRESQIPIPVSTREIVIEVVFTNQSGFASLGMMDNASAMLVLDQAPPPIALNTELLDNGGFETGDIINPALATSWIVQAGEIQLRNYGTTSAPVTDVATTVGGGAFIAGVDGSPDTRVTQTINVTGNAADIDAGNLEVFLSGFFGGIGGATDDASLTVRFFNAGSEIGAGMIGPVSRVERNFEDVVQRREGAFAVPVGTRKLEFELEYRNNDNFDLFGLADNLGAMLRNVVPPPPLVVGTQLLANGDFESGAILDLVSSDGWTPVAGGGLAVDFYGTPDTPSVAHAVSTGGGAHILRANGSTQVIVRQVFDLVANQAEVMTGTLGIDIQGFFGGTGNETDTVQLNVRYLNDTLGEITSDSIGAVTRFDRNDMTTTIFREGSFVVPIGTRFLILELQFDNNNGFGNLGLVDTVGATLFDSLSTGAATYPGSDEDLLMFTGISGPISTGPTFDIKEAGIGDILTVRVDSIQGTFDFAPIGLGVQLFTGAPPLGPANFPELHLDPGDAQIVVGPTIQTPFGPPLVQPNGNTYDYFVPSGFVGARMLVQGIALSSAALNGFFSATDGHEIVFVP